MAKKKAAEADVETQTDQDPAATGRTGDGLEPVHSQEAEDARSSALVAEADANAEAGEGAAAVAELYPPGARLFLAGAGNVGCPSGRSYDAVDGVLVLADVDPEDVSTLIRLGFRSL